MASETDVEGPGGDLSSSKTCPRNFLLLFVLLVADDLVRRALVMDHAVVHEELRGSGDVVRRSRISWVTTIMVMPSWASVRITASTSPTSSGSSADVGSSNSITSGRMASARAIATRCC